MDKNLTTVECVAIDWPLNKKVISKGDIVYIESMEHMVHYKNDWDIDVTKELTPRDILIVRKDEFEGKSINDLVPIAKFSDYILSPGFVDKFIQKQGIENSFNVVVDSSGKVILNKRNYIQIRR